MQTFSRVVELAADGAAQPSEDDVLAALAPRFALGAAGRPRTLRRTWLDTFDWRLHRAGLTLEYVTGPRPAQLVLATAAGDQVSQPAGRLTWPAMVRDLPPGPVTAVIRPAAGIRALLAVARATSAVQDLRVLNPDTKTIAWIRADRTTVSHPAAAQLPARLQVTAVRGYQPQAERVGELLAAAAGLERPPGPAAGRRPGRRGPARRGVQQQGQRPPRPGHARPGGPPGGAAAAAGHAGGQRAPAPSGTSTPSSCMTCGSPSGGPGPRSSSPGTCCPPACRPGSAPSSSGWAT